MNYYSARELLNGKDFKKVDNNTYLERIGDKKIGLRLHATHILIFTPTYVELDDGGYPTPTTWKRMRDFAPVEIRSNGKRGMSISPRVTLHPYYCENYQCREDNGFTYDQPGDWTKVGPERFVCNHCGREQAAMKRADWSTEFVYYAGVRVKPDGSGLMKTQPNRPASYEPTVTRSGFTGLSSGESRRWNQQRFSGGFQTAVATASIARAVTADPDMSLEDKATTLIESADAIANRAELVPVQIKRINPQNCPFVIIDGSHYNADGSCKCSDPAERERMVRDWDYSAEDFKAKGLI